MITLNEPVEANLIIIGADHQRSSRGQHAVYVPQQPPNKFQTATVDPPPAQLVSQRPELIKLGHRGEPAPLHTGRPCHQLRSVGRGGGALPSVTWSPTGQSNASFSQNLRLTFPPQVLPRWPGPRDRGERVDVAVPSLSGPTESVGVNQGETETLRLQ